MVKENQYTEQMYITRENGETILSYINFSKPCSVSTYFLELNQKVGQEDIIFPFSSSSRDIECQNKHMIKL